MTGKTTRSKPRTKTYRQTRVKDNNQEPSFIELARRQQIMEVSLDLFREKGFQKTSLADIAEALKISKGVISYHFDGKADLGEQVLRHALRNYGTFIRKQLEPYQTAQEKVMGILDAALKYLKEHRFDYLVYNDTLSTFSTPEDRRKFQAEQDRGLRRYLVSLIDEAKAESGTGNLQSEPIADMIQAMVDGLLTRECADPGAVDLETCAQIFRDMLRGQFELE